MKNLIRGKTLSLIGVENPNPGVPVWEYVLFLSLEKVLTSVAFHSAANILVSIIEQKDKRG